MARRKAVDAEAALDQAQELIYNAWEADTAKRRIAIAGQALAISPLCADAYVLLAEHAKTGTDAELDLWRRGVEAGEAALGPAAFEELAGSFWGFLETRPYMRARFGLARALWKRGKLDEAIGHLRMLLTLNPGDNQGIRYVLAAYLAEAARDDELAALLADYPDEDSAVWTWTAALVAFRLSGTTGESGKSLAEALANNRHVPPYLLGDQKLPKQLPPFITPGGKDEAIYYADEFGASWTLTPGVIDWLRAQTPALKPPRRPRGAKLQ